MKIEEAFGVTLQKHRTLSKMSQEQLALNSSLDRTYSTIFAPKPLFGISRFLPCLALANSIVT
ncbi:hypothetical protein QUF88_19640 [Bacillus sp. DX1.1]|uniref:hypothetical protein n=1 Tax=unclassified Bacillus (in: firmicutes) TaxID=185979 RepID=UPI0025705454|nr:MULTISPECIES: hypothetical protein [unclassified Bacillus (in: firmicutes)]MDM5155925.1 hypothetical protein [Bacillus sp. DX1.1]WJE80219.1 hypothetical protein QRE67_17170 [Bacillus sp. DX3.1]